MLSGHRLLWTPEAEGGKLLPSLLLGPQHLTRKSQPESVPTGKQGWSQDDSTGRKSSLPYSPPLWGRLWALDPGPDSGLPLGPTLGKAWCSPGSRAHSFSLPSLPDNGACSESSHDAGDDAESGPGPQQPGEHPWRV